MAYRANVLESIDIEKFREYDFLVYNGLMTKKDMAERLGVSKPTLAKYHDELVIRTFVYNFTHGYFRTEDDANKTDDEIRAEREAMWKNKPTTD